MIDIKHQTTIPPTERQQRQAGGVKAQETVVDDHTGWAMVGEDQQIEVAIQIEVGDHQVDRGPRGG